MKFKSAHLIAFLALGMVVTSCKKEVDDTDDDTPAAFTTSFSAKVDGVNFNETIYTAMESSGAQRITISASENGSFPALGFSFSNTITPGTYTFGAFSPLGQYNAGSSTSMMYSTQTGPGGTLTITSHDLSKNQIVGTFSFVAQPVPGSGGSGSHTITEGTFSAQY